MATTDIDYDAWQAQMIASGWVPVRDVFQNIVQYTYERPAGKPLVLEAVHFSMWAGLGQTPPPF